MWGTSTPYYTISSVLGFIKKLVKKLVSKLDLTIRTVTTLLKIDLLDHLHALLNMLEIVLFWEFEFASVK